MALLSKRAAQNVGMYIGHLPVSLTEVVDDSNWIDLSFAENYLIRDEVLQVLKESVSSNAASKDLNWPHGFWGEAELLTAMSSLYNNYFNPATVVANKDVVLTTGAAGSLDALAWSLCDAGEGVLIPCPYHAGAYEVFLTMHTGIVPVPIGVTGMDDVFGAGMIPTLEAGLKNSPVPIKAVVLTNPHNPLGRCYSKEKLIELMQFCQKHNLHLISDEVFALSEHGCSDLRKPRKFVSALSIDTSAIGCDENRIHVIWSFSKDLGATGARLASVVTRNKDVRDSIALVAHTSVSNLSILFARALLTSPKLHDIIQLNASRLSMAHDRIKSFLEAEKIEHLPCEATTFVLARLAPYAESRADEQAAISFYQDRGVLFFSASDYRMPPDFKGWMRVSFAVEPDRLDAAFGRLRAAYKEYMKRKPVATA